MLTLSFQLLCFCPCEWNEQLRKYKNCSLLVVGARNRAEVGRFLIRQRRIEFFSRVDQKEREERKFFPFALVKLLDAD